MPGRIARESRKTAGDDVLAAAKGAPTQQQVDVGKAGHGTSLHGFGSTGLESIDWPGGMGLLRRRTADRWLRPTLRGAAVAVVRSADGLADILLL